MSSEYGEKSREDLKGTARAQIKKAETSVPCTAIMDVNWKALIAAMNTQVDMLSEIQESLKTLATKEYMLEVADNLQRLSDMGKTLFIITHDPELIAKCCNYFVFIEHGKTVWSGGWTDGNKKRIADFFSFAG